LRKVPKNGGVIIANPGETMTGTYAYGPAAGQHRWLIANWGETYRINCPFCSDTRHRLWINHRYGQPDAAMGGQPMKALAICFNEDCLKDYDNREQLFEWIFEIRRRGYEVPRISEAGVTQAATCLAPCTWPGDMCPLPDFALSYLAQRGFYADTVQRFDLRFCVRSAEFPSAAGRIIAPIVMHGTMIGWQGRSIGDGTYGPKYYTKPQFPKRMALYNLDAARGRSFGVVFEGITDVWRLPGYGMALLGKTMSLQQQVLLREAFPEAQPIILCLDPETWDNCAMKIHEMIQGWPNPIVRVKLPDGCDPADMDHASLLNAILTQSAAVGVPLPV